MSADIVDTTIDEAQLLRVLKAFRKGDFSARLPVDWTGTAGRIADTFNDIIEMNERMDRELARVNRVVGQEGKIKERASIGTATGSWSGMIDSVNSLLTDLVRPTTEIARVVDAVAGGDLSQFISLGSSDDRPLRGEFLRTARTVNTMVSRLGSFTAEVTRVAREVGIEGKLGGQTKVKGVSGIWRDLTDSVNNMALNLTSQIRNIAEVTTAVASGDLSKKVTVDVRGEFLKVKETINTMVDQLSSFAAEVTRVAREVGSEGKLGGQADVKGVSGTWKDLTDNVNFMAANLTNQVRNIATVTTAVANGDLSKKVTVDVRGEVLELKETINTMVDQLSSFAAEVTRVAREVGSEGKLGGQADVKGVSGTWKDLTDNVNFMAANLTNQVRNIATVTTAVANGDLSKKVTVDVRGEVLQLKETINTMVDQLSSFAAEVTRVAREVGSEGKLGGQADVKGVSGTWKGLTDNVNFMAANLTNQVRNIATVTTAVANGDLSKKVTVDVRGEVLELKETINTMVDQLSSFAAEVTRVAREVGTEGKLGGQAFVQGVAGTWKDLTDNVNFMASNLTGQVRGIAKVVTAVANGDLKRKLVVAAKGEIAELSDTINAMTDTLATFADQVTSVAREVGVEGKLGGQASVPGAAGTWKDLTDNVNQLAANLTTQVRAIAEVAIAVTRGDLTRSIGVETRGEVAILKDNINEMIRNLRETTQKNSEQDWLKGNLAKFTRMLQGQRDLLTVSRLILSELAPVVEAHHGVFYIVDTLRADPHPGLRLLASYAYTNRAAIPQEFAWGEGLVGQAAAGREWILLSDVPSNYIRISSGLGEAAPANIIVLPILFEGATKAVIELASFKQFSPTHQTFLAQLAESIGIVLNTIEANMRTEELLKQSQSLAHELQEQQEELQQTNAELQSKAKLLVEQNKEVERKNREVEFAKRALEEKAEQLSLTSKYKSEFLSNMSHELRTPLNSLLILSKQLGENHGGNLTPRQVEFADTIHAAGSDLLTLINDILDLSKIESGTVTVDVSEVTFADVRESMERTFRPIADGKTLKFMIDIDPALPRVLYTDAKRLFQVLKNLLANAFKFTPLGAVELRAVVAHQGWSVDHPILNSAKSVVAFSVSDTGIGIAREKQKVIFEAFQQADGSTNRKYGGTGLGLSISREIARLLGGEITLNSNPGHGSTFTLYLPHVYAWPKPVLPPLQEPTESAPLAPVHVVSREVANRFPAEMADDRSSLRPDDFLVLIIEDDPDFAEVLLRVVRDRGYKGIVALRGETGLALAREYRPQAITLDVRLPDMDGWDLLRRMRELSATSQIPIHVITGEESAREDASNEILTFLQKPVSKEMLEEALMRVRGSVLTVKNLLVVEDDPVQREAILSLVEPDRMDATGVGTGGEALEALEAHRYDCLVIDLRLPDMSGQQLIERIRQERTHSQIPIIVYTAATLSRREKAQLKKSAQTIVQKNGQSHEQLLDEVATFLYKVTGAGRKITGDDAVTPEQLTKTLAGKKVLVVDDDIRNIFALTSLLERQNMAVMAAENGRTAIQLLEENADINIVLMDVMMPEMDGYETMRAIRLNPQFRTLPIIALTAKAMRGDREKCIDAGATEYVAKPVDSGRLLSLLHVWLHSEAEERVKQDQTSVG